MPTVYQRLAARLKELAREEAAVASPPVRRARVLSANPLRVEYGGDVLEEGEDDVEFDEALKTDRPAVGDLVRVHTAVEGEDRGYLVEGRIVDG